MFNTYDSKLPYYNQMNYDEDILDRFWSKVSVKYKKDGTPDFNACMEWIASLVGHDGYPGFGLNGKVMRGNRFIYECFNGPISNNLLVCHSCDNPKCVNPYHLWLGTDLDNTKDRDLKNRGIKGSYIHTSKLNEEIVEEILTNIHLGIYSNIFEINKQYNIHVDTIREILRGKNWKHVSNKVVSLLGTDLNKIRYSITAIDRKGSNNGNSKSKRRNI